MWYIGPIGSSSKYTSSWSSCIHMACVAHIGLCLGLLGATLDVRPSDLQGDTQGLDDDEQGVIAVVAAEKLHIHSAWMTATGSPSQEGCTGRWGFPLKTACYDKGCWFQQYLPLHLLHYHSWHWWSRYGALLIDMSPYGRPKRHWLAYSRPYIPEVIHAISEKWPLGAWQRWQNHPLCMSPKPYEMKNVMARPRNENFNSACSIAHIAENDNKSL
jgi:hypothetical protein